MAALNFNAASGEYVIGTNAMTYVALVAPTNQRVKIKGVSIFGKGTNNTDVPVKVELLTFVSLSGGTSHGATATKKDGDVGEALQTQITGTYGTSATAAEPTYTSAVAAEVWECHPQGGLVINFPQGEEYVLKGTTGFAVRLTASQTETMSVTVYAEE